MDDKKTPLPGAPPDRVKAAVEVLYDEWQKAQAERQQWQLERAQMRARILQLEADARTHEQVRVDLIRRIKLLEHGLMQERNNYLNNQPPSKLASHLSALAYAHHFGPGGVQANGHLMPNGRIYRTLPHDFLAKHDNVSPGRAFLREYLLELGYLKEASHLDGRYSRYEEKLREEAAALAAAKASGVLPPTASASNSISSTTTSTSDGESKKESRMPIKGSFAKPAKPSSVTTNRRGSVDDMLLEGKSADSKKWKAVFALRSHLDGVRCLDFHSTDPMLLSGSEDGTVKFWNLSTVVDSTKRMKKKAMEPNYTYRAHTGMVTSVVYDDRNSQSFSAGVDGLIYVWDLPSVNQDPYGSDGRCMRFRKRLLRGHNDAVWCVKAHPASASFPLLFSASADKSVGVWKTNTDSTTPASTLMYASADGVNQNPTTLSVMHSDSKKLLVGYASGDLVQFDIETGQVVRSIAPKSPSGNAHMSDLASHPTLTLALTAHVDQNVRVYDFAQGACVNVIQTHRDMVTSVSIESGGLTFASASHDQSIRFWDLTTKKIIQDLDGYQTHRRKYDEAIHSVRFHSSLPVLASAGADSIVKLYQ